MLLVVVGFPVPAPDEHLSIQSSNLWPQSKLHKPRLESTSFSFKKNFCFWPKWLSSLGRFSQMGVGHGIMGLTCVNLPRRVDATSFRSLFLIIETLVICES